MKEVGGVDAVGPILLGIKKPVHVLQLGSSVRDIVNIALVAVLDAQNKHKSEANAFDAYTDYWQRLRNSKNS